MNQKEENTILGEVISNKHLQNIYFLKEQETKNPNITTK